MPALIETFANNAPTNLTSTGYSAVATSLVMTSITGYPSAPQFRLLNPRTAEVMLVTAIAGVTLTVTRGVENTTPQIINSGDALTHILTAGALVNLSSVLPQQQVTVPAGSATFTISGLDLNADGAYEVEFNGVWAGSFANSTACVVYPNGSLPSNVNGLSHRAYTGNGQDMGGASYSTIELFRSDFSVGTGGIEVWFRMRVRLSATSRKHFEIDSYFVGSATNLMWAKNVLVWHDTTTNITSLQLHPNAGTLSGTVKVRMVR
jgi:hypothetical protein